MVFNEFSQFFQQLPPELIANICTVGILLIVALVYIGYIRPSRARRRQMQEIEELRAAAMRGEPAGGHPTLDTTADDDLPDLDMLTLDADDPLHPDNLPAPETDPLSRPLPAALATETREEAIATDLPDMKSDTTTHPDLRTNQFQAEALPLRSGGRYAVKLDDGQTVGATEQLAILRDPADDRLMIYMDGVAYRSLSDQPEVKAEFTKLIKELTGIINDPVPPRPSDAPSVIGLAETPHQPPPLKPSETPGKLPNYADHRDKVIPGGPLRGPRREAEPVPELNIAAAIESFLQHKLRQTPDYYGRSIHIHPAPDGGVRIEVDGRYYEGVDEVADDEVRAFLRTTIDEWQESQ